MDYYQCPTCKTANEDYIKYCKKCGAWLLSDTFPAKKIVKQSLLKKVTKIFGITAVVVIGLIGVLLYISQGSTGTVTFPDMVSEEEYKISQFVVEKTFTSLSASADVTMLRDMENPLDIVAVFYDRNNKRLTKAEGSISHKIRSGQTTTIDLTFDRDIDIKAISSVRIELIPISPLETLNRYMEQVAE